jgi:hypothetical protein
MPIYILSKKDQTKLSITCDLCKRHWNIDIHTCLLNSTFLCSHLPSGNTCVNISLYSFDIVHIKHFYFCVRYYMCLNLQHFRLHLGLISRQCKWDVQELIIKNNNHKYLLWNISTNFPMMPIHKQYFNCRLHVFEQKYLI